MSDWDETIAEAKRIGLAFGLDWAQVRNAVIDARVAEDPSFYEGHGIGSSDGNHMVYGAVKSFDLAEILMRYNARNARLNDLAADLGVAPVLLRQQIAEFLR